MPLAEAPAFQVTDPTGTEGLASKVSVMLDIIDTDSVSLFKRTIVAPEQATLMAPWMLV